MGRDKWPYSIEMGTEAETERAVREALDILVADGGYILSPVDNVREDTENTWRNIRKLVETWKEYR